MARLVGTSGNDNFQGTEENDDLFGGSIGDINEEGTGDDLLNGLGGDDTLRGGDGDDGLFGGDGIDRIFGEIGNDTLDGGLGDDTLNGADGDNQAQVSDEVLVASLNPFTNDSANASANIVLRTVENGIEFTVELLDTTADINGVFFNLTNTELLDSLKDSSNPVTGENVTGSKFGPTGSVNQIEDANDQFNININPGAFDAGIAIGTPSIGGEDDIRSTTFTLQAPEGSSLSLDDFVEESFGLRLTSVGAGRQGSSKLSGIAQAVENFGIEDDDVIFGQSGNDIINGEEGNDLLDGGAGDDEIDGGSGIDRAGYLGTFRSPTEQQENPEQRGNNFVIFDNEGQEAYQITLNSPANLGITVTDLLTDGDNVDSGEDTLTNVEFLDFGGLTGVLTGTVDVAGLFDDQELNETPEVNLNRLLTINENQTNRILNTFLEVTDDNAANEITYTLASVPRQGTLFLDTNAEGSSGGRFNVVFNEGEDRTLEAGDTFTQGQIDNGLLGYQAPDVNPDVNDESSDFSFRFTASDPQDEETTGSFKIEVNPLNAPTVEDAEFLVSEFAVNEQQIGTLEFEDPDSDELSFEITDASSAFVTRSLFSSPVPEDIDTDNDGDLPFTINEQGQITVNDTGDLEPLELFAASFSDFNVFIREFPSFDLTVEVSDGTNTVEAQVDVDILGAPIAFGFGDPRVTTFDRNTFDFQVVGEFTLVESTDENNPLTVQARTEAAPLPDGGESDSLSNYKAVAVEFDGQEIAIYSGEENPVVVNGNAITLEVGEILPVGDSGIEITRPEIQGSDDDQEGGSDFYQINLDDQERLIVQVFDNRLDPQIQLSDQREGNVTGVFGNNDGNLNNDFVLPDGTILDNPSLEQINNDFADAWRITDPSNSLLVREDENLEDINNLEFPRLALTIDNFQEELGLTDEEVSDIEEQVRDAGIPEGPLFDAAVIDFAATNDDSFLASSQNVAESNVAPTVEDADFTIGEDLPNDRVVGSVNISDADDNIENLTVTITEGNPDTNDDGEAAFAIDGVTGNLTINDSDELAARGSTFTLTVVAEDPLGTRDTATVTVTEQNAPPVFGEFQTDFSINRQAVESGDSLVTLAVTDGNDDPLRFSIQGNQDRDEDGVRPFRVNEDNQLIINDRGDLTSDFDLTVTVNDGQGGSDTVDLSIDVNLAPTFAQSQFQFAPVNLTGEGENAQTGDIVGQVTASDPDGNPVFFEIIGGNDRNNDGESAFTINQRGQIRISSLTEIVDTAEAGNNYNLRVSASDAGDASTFADVIIPLNIAENQAPVLPTQAFTIPETATAETQVGTVFADDPEGDEITFSLTDASGNFTIDPDSGLITVADEATFDFENRSGFGLDVTATDSEGNVTGPNRINVNLSDVNDESPVITPPDEPFTVAENAEAGTILGTIEANDPDGLEGEPDELTFSITGGNTDVDGDGTPAFAINNENGQLEVNDPDDIDFENETNDFNLTVRVSDGVNDPDSATVTINVTNQNEPPVITVPDINTVDVENSTEGNSIVTIEADDPEDNDFTFSIIAGNPNTDGDENPALAIGETTETTAEITIADLDDFTATLRPTILVEDETGARTSQQITIPVDTAENDPPVFEEDAFNFEVPENSAATTVVGTVEATDADPDSSLTFDLEENDNFVINSDGEITVAEEATLDFEGTNTFNLTVTVTDEIIDTPVEAPVTINLTNVDEPPVFEAQQALSTIRANAPVGTVIDTIEANDPENDPITFEITDGNPDGDGDETPALAIDNAGRVTVADTDDLIADENITLTVEISQGEEFQETITATIAIGEIDNQPPNITTDEAEQTINENQTDVVAVEADDPNGDALTFSLSGGDDQGFFTIDGDGNLSFSEAPNFENPADTDGNNVYQVQVEVDDDNGGIDTQDFSITVNDVNEAPVVEDQSFTIDENSDVGTEIDTVEASDPEEDAVTFSFDQDNLPTDVDGDEELPFDIADDGLITVNDSGDLDFETQDSFSFGVVATESDGDQFGTGTVTVNLDDVEEPTFDLDVDDNGAANGSVDGLNILRVLFNLGPETMDVSQAGDLTQQEVFNNIQEGNQEENPILDVDNNGAANGSVDGLNILRVLFNLGPETMDVSQAGDLTQQDVFNNIEALETTV